MSTAAKEKQKPKPKPTAGSHPPYLQMIREAILALRDRTGSSAQAIAKHVEEKHEGQLPANFRKILSVQLRSFAAKGKLVKVKASFKLSEEAKMMEKSASEKQKQKPKPKTKILEAVKSPEKAGSKVKRKAASPAKPKQPKSIKSSAAKKVKKKKKGNA